MSHLIVSRPPPPASPAAAPSFGATVGGVSLVLPAGVPVAFLADVAVLPLAGAPLRVMGLMQLQGHPVVVLDPSVRPIARAPAPRRQSVLVLGAVGEAAALWVDAAPAPIAIGEPIDAPRPENCVFAEALTEPVADAGHSGRVWWHFSPNQLFEVLARQAEVVQ